MSDHSPGLSVVVLARRGLNGYLGLLAHLARQRAARRVEVVVVASDDAASAECAPYADAFARLRVVVDARVAVRGQGAAVAVRVASAPLVALTEDHSYPEPEWAERLIAAHEAGGRVAIGASVANANPRTAWGRVNHDLSYGKWTLPAQAGETEDVPGFNSAFDRAELLAYGDRLVEMLDRPGDLHADLRRRGGRFWFEPAARLSHWDPSNALPSLHVWMLGGRMFGASRARQGRWSLARRVLFAGAVPLIPLMRLRGFLRDAPHRRDRDGETAGYWAALVAVICAISAGEAIGYLAGEGDVVQSLADYEFGRDRYVLADEAAQIRRMHEDGRRPRTEVAA